MVNIYDGRYALYIDRCQLKEKDFAKPRQFTATRGHLRAWSAGLPLIGIGFPKDAGQLVIILNF